MGGYQEPSPVVLKVLERVKSIYSLLGLGARGSFVMIFFQRKAYVSVPEENPGTCDGCHFKENKRCENPEFSGVCQLVDVIYKRTNRRKQRLTNLEIRQERMKRESDYL